MDQRQRHPGTRVEDATQAQSARGCGRFGNPIIVAKVEIGYFSTNFDGRCSLALSIKNPETERLARELARVTGESLTEAVTEALRDRLVRETGQKADREQVRAEIRRIQSRVAALPVLDDRTPDEIIGYDEYGLPT